MSMRRMAILLAITVIALLVQAQLALPLPSVVRTAAKPPLNANDRGRAVYRAYGCALCHGADAKGGFANPNSETDGKVPGVIFVAEGYTNAELRKMILNGNPNIGREDSKGPRPPYRMPGWRGQMSDDEVNDLVSYLMSLYPKSAEEKWR